MMLILKIIGFFKDCKKNRLIILINNLEDLTLEI